MARPKSGRRFDVSATATETSSGITRMSDALPETARRDPSALRTPPTGRIRRRRRLDQRTVAPYVFLAPFVLLFLGVLVVPFGFAAWLSVHSWDGFGDFEPVGLGNYRELLASEEFHVVVGNTLIFASCILLSLIPASMVLAVALHSRRLRARGIFRSVLIAPTAVSTAAVAIVFILVFDPQFGLVNAGIVSVFGGGGINWIGDAWPARLSIMAVVFWRSLGLTVLFFLAGLQNISQDQIDAAHVDGADGRRVFWHVVLPGLRPITAFVTVIGIISMLQLFEEPFLLTAGGPSDSTRTIVQLSYQAAFVEGRFGYAASVGVLMVIVILLGAAAVAWYRRWQSGREARAAKGPTIEPTGERR